MIFLVFLIAFIVSYIAIYIVGLFGKNVNPVSVLITTAIIWGISIILTIFEIKGIIGMGIYTIVSMISFMKFLGFEPTQSFIAGLFYSVIYNFLLIFIFSLFA